LYNMRSADALRRYLQGEKMPTTTRYPWRPPVNPQSVTPNFNGGGSGEGIN
jgi:hypothetical protein